MKKHYLILLFVISYCFSCQNGNNGNEVSNFIDSSIIFPSTLVSYNVDTLLRHDVDTCAPLKMVVYLNSSQCDDCKLRELVEWKKIMKDDTVVGDTNKVNFVFIFNPKSISGLRSALILYHFDLPVYYDESGEFEAANLLPEDPMFHTFLLDKEGKVRLIGSPIGNSKMWELYKQTIKILTTENWCSKGGFFGV